MIFFDEHTDGGGSSALDLLGPVTPPATAPVEPVTPSVGVSNEPQPAAPTAPVFDPSAFAMEFGTVLRDVLPAPAAPAAPQLTPEEARRQLNFMEFSPEFFTTFDNLETRQRAFEQLRDGIFRQADTVAQRRVEAMQAQLQEILSPILEHYQAATVEAERKEFGTSFPQLADQRLWPMVEQTAAQLRSEGAKFADKPSLFKAIASRVEAVIQVTNPGFKLSTAQVTNPAAVGQPTKPTLGSANTLPTATPGGGGGGGQGPATVANPTGSKAIGLLGSVTKR